MELKNIFICMYVYIGAMVTTEALKHALDLLIPSASSAMQFSTTGITLAFIQRQRTQTM